MPDLSRFFPAVTVFLLSVLLFLPARADPAQVFKAHTKGSSLTVDHSTYDRLLKRYVHATKSGLNVVDYGEFKKTGHAELKQYLTRLQAVDVKGLDRDEQFAFWVNLYNAKTLDVILQRYPVSSIKDIWSGLFSPGPWKLKNMKVAGVDLTLDDVEHVILRGLWGDPRIHYAVNCAAIGCPNLFREAFTSKNLARLLETGARNYVNSPRGARFSKDRLTVSKIYKWFIVDFGNSEQGVLKHLRRYAAPELAERLKKVRSISSYEYDWALNDRR